REVLTVQELACRFVQHHCHRTGSSPESLARPRCPEQGAAPRSSRRGRAGPRVAKVRPGLGQFGIRVAGQKAFGRIIVDEGVVGEPFDGPADGAGIAKGVPRWQQTGIFLVELVLEPAEGSPTLYGP